MPDSTGKRPPARALLGALPLLAFAACSRLPEAAAPKFRGEISERELATRDVIPYRTLTRDDFRATAPPAEFAAIASKLGATTCSHLLTAADTKVLVTERRSPEGESEFASRPHNVRFRALMDRTCSWWNEKLAAQEPAYVLEHEQIHFAITELEARRLNAAADEFMAQDEFEAGSQEEALKLAQRAIEEMLLEGSRAVLERSRDFDEDTSMGYEPERQRSWFSRISAELEETRAWALR